MTKNLIKIGALCMPLAFSNYALAAAEVTNEAAEAYQQSLELQQARRGGITIPATLGEAFDPQPAPTGDHGFLYNQWSKAKLKFHKNLISKNLTIMGHASLGFVVDYNYLVQPAFIQNKQQRLDSYSAGINLTIPVGSLSAGTSLSGQATFSRIIDDKNTAAIQTPYFLNRIPWNTSVAKNDLNPGDMVRVEISSSANGGRGMYSGHSGFGTSLYASISRGAHLILDVYKMNKDYVRVRLIAVRRAGDFSGNIGVEAIHPATLAANVVQKLVSDSLSVQPVSLGVNKNGLSSMPVETYLLDYVFNLENAEAVAAYDILMKNIKAVNVAEYINFQLKEKTVGERMLVLAKDVQELVKKYSQFPVVQRPVDRIFQGQTSTRYTTTHLGSQLKLGLNLWNKQLDNSDSRTSVQGYDDQNASNQMLYLSFSDVNNTELGFDLFQTLNYNQVEALVDSKSGKPGISDIVFTKNLSDKSMNDDQILAAQSYIHFTAPGYASQIDWSPYLNGKSKHNGYVQIKTVFHEEAINSIAGVSEREIYDRFHSFISQYPNSTEQTHLRYEYDIRIISKQFSIILNQNSVLEEKLNAFSRINGMSLFQELGTSVISSFLPPSQFENLVYLSVEAGAAELQPISKKFGNNSLTKAYSSLQFMLSLVNNRSFDLRLQIDSAENYKEIPR